MTAGDPTSDVGSMPHHQMAIHEDEEQGDVGAIGGFERPASKSKKNKGKKRPKGRRGWNAPSGFEEYSADAPITPAEYAKEQLLYDQSRPFIDRILIAMQRYETKRRMDNERRDIFYTYLIFGGVEAGPNMFQGLNQEDLDEMDADEIALATTRVRLSSEKETIGKETSKWVVDFEGIAKGFFSSRAPARFDLSTEATVKNVTNVVHNFLNYLLHHDVCPEYVDQIRAAKAVCNLAAKELHLGYNAELWLPGDFNIACSTLFGGDYMGRYDGVAAWADEKTTGFIGMTDETARQVVKFGIAGAGTLEQTMKFSELAKQNALCISRIVGHGFEVTEIIPADKECRQLYKQHCSSFRPVGRIKARPWTNPLQPEPDLTPAEKQTIAVSALGEECEPYEFFIEEQGLQYCFVGMKVDATIRELNCGIMFIDRVLAVYCSFYDVLPNELMLDWKEPKERSNEVVHELAGQAAPDAMVPDGKAHAALVGTAG